MMHYSPRPSAKYTRAVIAAKDYEVYDARELQRNPGIPDERFRAYELPSRIGNQLFYPQTKETKNV